MDFHNFFIVYVFEVKKSISDIPTELPCLGDLKNPGQLPVQEVLRGTDDCVLWIFTISSVFMFSRSRNPFLTFLLSYYVSGDLENLGQLSVQEVLIGTDDFVLWIFIISSVFMFSMSRNPFLSIPAELPCSGDLDFRGHSKLLSHHGIQARIFWPLSQLSKIQEVLTGTDDFVLWIFTISSVFMFSRSRNPFLTFLLSYHVWVTSKI